MNPPPPVLLEAVQTNCHIADARHAQDLSLCTFLLQMREFHRWERGLPLDMPLARAEVGRWIAQREALWAEMEEREFERLPVQADADALDAFQVEAINAGLVPQGLVYGAGWAGVQRPAFFLAELEVLRPVGDGLVVQVCGREWARGLFAPPAALSGATIVLRRESMARWLWEKFEAFGLKRADGPFRAVAQAYGLEQDFRAGLPRLLDEQGETLILHEIGEHRAGLRLGAVWADMRLALGDDRRADLLVRAVRDQIADLETTLPALLERGPAASIHFWFAGYDGLRRQLFPGLVEAYRAWCDGNDGRALRSACEAGARHFVALAERVLDLHATHADVAAPHIAALLSEPRATCALNGAR